MSYIPQQTIDKVKEAMKMEEVASDYITLKRSGKSLVGECPFHGGKSFYVTPGKEFYKCFGCGKSGNAISFLMDFKRINYPEAIQLLIDKYNII